MLRSGPFKIALLYVIVSLVWISGSDRFLFLFKSNFDNATFLMLNSIKGACFVTITGAVLFLLIRKSTIEVLKHKNEYREIYDANPSPMWIYDPQTFKFISVNDTALSVYGYSRLEFLNMTIQDVRPVEENERLIKVFNKDGQYQKTGIWKHLKKDGSTFFVDISSHKINFRDNDAVLVLARDYSQTVEHQEMLEQVNQTLNDEKKRLSDIQEFSKIAGWDYYVDNRRLVLSDEMYKIFNINKNLLNVDYHVFLKAIHRDDLHNFISEASATINRGNDLDVIHRIYLGKNNIRYIRELGKMEYREGKPYKIRGTMQDITELKRIELEHDLISNENRKLDNIITKINNMVILIDTESRITWVNKAYEKFSGYVLDEVVGKRPSVFMTDTSDPMQLAKIDSAQERLEAFSVDITLFNKAGEPYWVNIEFTPMFDMGKYVGYITVHNNITARKEKEAEITKQNIILRDIAWLSSHEIRRPTASIMGLIDLIKTSDSEQDKEEYMRLLDECTLQLDHIIHQINDTIYEKLPETIT